MKMSAQMTVVAVLATLAYLGLAVWGIGGVALFFSHGSLVIVALATVAMVIASLFSEVNLSSGEREDRANRWVLPAFGVIGLVSGFLPAYCDRVNFWTLGGEGVRWLGALLFIVGGALRLWPVFVLGRRFSGLVAIQPGHRLVTDGIYQQLRNPSYLGMVVNAVGWALAFRSVVGLDAGGADADPVDRADSFRRSAAAGAVWGGVRCLLRAELAFGAGSLLTRGQHLTLWELSCQLPQGLCCVSFFAGEVGRRCRP